MTDEEMVTKLRECIQQRDALQARLQQVIGMIEVLIELMGGMEAAQKLLGENDANGS